MRHFPSLFSTHYFLLIVLLLVHLFLLLNLRFEAWPEMLVYPYLLNHGFELYRDIINPYTPGLIWLLAGFFKLTGLAVANLQLFTWVIILLSDALIYWITLRRFGPKSALVGLGFFVVFQPLLDGNGVWFDLFLTPLLLLAFLFRSSLLLSFTLFIKQSVAWLFVLFIRQWSKVLVYLVSFFVIFAIPFILQQTLFDYLFWAWRFPFTIFPLMPGYKDLGSLRSWLIALVPFIPILFFKLLTKPKFKQLFSSTDPFIWMGLSFTFIFPRFGLFHLQPALAFASLSLAYSLQLIKLKKYKLFAISYVLLASWLWVRQIKLYWHQPPRFFEPDIVATAIKLKHTTTPRQPLLFVNSPDQLMVLADRLPAKPWVDTFPWYLELPHLQQQVIGSVSSQSVQGVVFSPYGQQGTYIPGSYRPAALDAAVHSQFTRLTLMSADIHLLTSEGDATNGVYK